MPQYETAPLVPGEVVTLHSGGLPMTIETMHAKGVVVCVWFGLDNLIHTGTFQDTSLRRVSPGESHG